MVQNVKKREKKFFLIFGPKKIAIFGQTEFHLVFGYETAIFWSKVDGLDHFDGKCSFS